MALGKRLFPNQNMVAGLDENDTLAHQCLFDCLMGMRKKGEYGVNFSFHSCRWCLNNAYTVKLLGHD